MKNILEVIKKAPKDRVYYSPLIGKCHVEIIKSTDYPIIAENMNNGMSVVFSENGKYIIDSEMPEGECVLFPSRDNRDWEAFERELDGVVSGKSFFDNTFGGTAEMVSIPDRPMMAAVIMSGMLAGGCKNMGGALVNKALHLADLILDETETKTKEE